MYDPLREGIDELLLARLELGSIPIPCKDDGEMRQLRQKIYARAKVIRSHCEKTKQLGTLYDAASTFTVLMDKVTKTLTISHRDNIVGVLAVKNALANIQHSVKSDIDLNLIEENEDKPDSKQLLDELLGNNLEENEKANPYYSKD